MSGRFCPEVISSGTFNGNFVREDYIWRDFVRQFHGGFCPEDYVWGGIVSGSFRRDFVRGIMFEAIMSRGLCPGFEKYRVKLCSVNNVIEILRLQLMVATKYGEYFLVLKSTIALAISSLHPLLIAV